MKRGRAIDLCLAIALLCSLSLQAPAIAGTQVVEFSRGVSYWYVPTETRNVFKRYELDIIQVEDLITGEMSASAVVATDRCRLVDPHAMSCNNRHEMSSTSAQLEIEADLSGAIAKIQLNRKTYVVRFEGPVGGSSRGVFDRQRHCSATARMLVGGAFANMESARGRLPWRRLEGPYTNGWDHAWLEHGVGSWC